MHDALTKPAPARPLTLRRVARLLATCGTPAAASRASERLYRLARCRAPSGYTSALLYLSTALNEHRHVILAGYRQDGAAVREHSANREEQVHWALRVARVA